MNLLSMLQWRRDLFEQAFQAALEQWQRHELDVDHPHCPACGSTDINISRGLPGRRSYRCRQCDYLCYEPSDPRCDCVTPGSLSKCEECLNYERLMMMVNERLASSTTDDER